MFIRVRIGRRERGFALHGGDLIRYLRPGVHWVRRCYTLERASLDVPTLESDHLRTLLRDPQVRSELEVIDLAQDQRAVVWLDGRLHAVWGPSRGGPVAYWQDCGELEIERCDASQLVFRHRRLNAILASPSGARELEQVTVPAGHRGLHYVDHALRAELEPGRYAFWRGVGQSAVRLVDQRTQTVDLTGQEVLTSDKVTLRVNLSATTRVADPRQWVEAADDSSAVIYRQLQLGLRRAIGVRRLDDVLQAKEQIAVEVHESVAPHALELGVRLHDVGLRDVILPGEMRALLNRVIEAEVRARAGVIERREETQATRSLLSTARLVEQSPTLMRLKELEAVERMVASVDSLHLIGGVEELLTQLLPPSVTGVPPVDPSA